MPDPRQMSESGIDVYPRLPVPKRESEARIPQGSGGGGKWNKAVIGVVFGAMAAGLVLGMVLRPMVAPDKRIGDLTKKAEEADRAAVAQKQRAEKLDQSLVEAMSQKKAADSKLAEAQKAQTSLADKAAELEKAANASRSEQAKLQATVDKKFGVVSADGDKIRLQLVDKVLFKTGDDQLTDNGKLIIDKVAVALKELSDKQVWVHGHTDDQPIYIAPPPKGPPPKKGAKVVPPVNPPDGRFATNWELSAARALTVVHHLQDVSKLDPTRLAALAFGQYQPISRGNKALNRRIEIVLYPKPALARK